jgi:hypothetical protein
MNVSIPQGVDVKHYAYDLVKKMMNVSIPQGVDVKHDDEYPTSIDPYMYQSHKGWTSNLLTIFVDKTDIVYQSHKGWTSNLSCDAEIFLSPMYQSHKGWTSNAPPPLPTFQDI